MISNRSLTITTLFVLSLIGAYTIYQPFLLSLVVAMLLTMATYNLTKQLIRMTGSRKISAAISTLFLIVIVFAPIVYLATVGVSYVAALDVKAVNTIFLTIRGLADGITFLDEWSDTVLSDQKVTAYIQTFTSYVTTAGTVGLGFIKNMFLVLVFFFMINFYGERFFDLIRALIPISRIKSAKMIHEISSTMEVVLYSIIATAIFEGVLFGVMMNVLGFDGLLLGLLYGFASLIPIIGGAILWVPMSLYAWSQGEVNTAILIALYSIIMISIIADTFIKPIIIKVIKEDLLKSTIKINEIVIFFSILAGMTTYGFWGMILGPAITSFLIAITKVYIDYNKSEQLR